MIEKTQNRTKMLSTTHLLLVLTQTLVTLCQEPGLARLVYTSAAVEAGREVTSLCLLAQLNTSATYTNFKPVLGRYKYF